MRKRLFWQAVLVLGMFAMLAGTVMTRCTFQKKDAPKLLLTIGGMTAEELEKALDAEKINFSSYARSMLKNRKEFIDPVNERESERGGRTAETLHLVRLRVRDMGFTSPPTTPELFARAKEQGLDLCPPEVGPYLRLADKDQPDGLYYIGMKPVTDSDGEPSVFYLGRDVGGLWLRSCWAGPDDRWFLDNRIVFRRCKSDS